jgi:hypothetical protein
MTDSTQPAPPARVASSGRARIAAGASLLRAGWLRLHTWRRARPFWAGVFLLIAGAELLLIPLPMHSMGLILHIGTGGVLGILIGAILITCGLLLWFNPAQRLFYSIVAVLLAVAALIASNLGGFLIGTILGIIGGSLGFAWTPLPPGTEVRHRARRPAASPPRPGRGTIIGGNILLSLLALLTSLLHPGSAQQPTTAPTPACSTPAPGPPLPLPAPTPSPSSLSCSPAAAAASPGPTRTPDPGGPAPTPSVSPSQRGSPSIPRRSPSPSASKGTEPPFALPSSASRLTASSASITGFTYDGLVTVPTAAGRVRMMQFSATSLDLSGVRLTVSQGGATLTTTASALDLTGHVILYATQLSGDLLGVPLTITPGSPLSDILRVAGQLGVTQGIQLQLTNVTTLQVFTAATAMRASALHIS